MDDLIDLLLLDIQLIHVIHHFSPFLSVHESAPVAGPSTRSRHWLSHQLFFEVFTCTAEIALTTLVLPHEGHFFFSFMRLSYSESDQVCSNILSHFSQRNSYVGIEFPPDPHRLTSMRLMTSLPLTNGSFSDASRTASVSSSSLSYSAGASSKPLTTSRVPGTHQANTPASRFVGSRAIDAFTSKSQVRKARARNLCRRHYDE
jgi:hypothetical protein